MDIARDRSQLAREKVTGMLFDETVDLGPTTVTNPMVSPDIGFVNMLRYGIVALQLLPENSSAGQYLHNTNSPFIRKIVRLSLLF